MYNDGSSPTLTNVIFSGNSATGDGGGMYNNQQPDADQCHLQRQHRPGTGRRRDVQQQQQPDHPQQHPVGRQRRRDLQRGHQQPWGVVQPDPGVGRQRRLEPSLRRRWRRQPGRQPAVRDGRALARALYRRQPAGSRRGRRPSTPGTLSPRDCPAPTWTARVQVRSRRAWRAYRSPYGPPRRPQTRPCTTTPTVTRTPTATCFSDARSLS